MKNIFVAGHRGMVGGAIVNELKMQSDVNIITRRRDELDLTDQLAVQTFFRETQIDMVYLAAAKVGGIFANNEYPATFIYENLMIQANVIHSAFMAGVRKLLFLGSSCIYPKLAAQPMEESSLLTGSLEPTNEPYAVAKIAGIKLCESYNRQYGQSHAVDFRSVMPTNLYGPGDNYHPENSHVVPSLIRRFEHAARHEEPTVTVWGTGQARREFLYVQDMARACVHVAGLEAEVYRREVSPMQSHINVGYGSDVSIAELASQIAQQVGYRGEIKFDLGKPDGAPRKLIDSSLIHRLGWHARVSLSEGLALTIAEYRKSLDLAER